MIDTTTLWIIIIGLGLGSFFLRFVFTGLVGDRAMPDWLLRHLRYTAVAVLPALVAPQVLWPSATGGDPDPARMSAAVVTLTVGLLTKNVLAAMLAGAATLYGMLYLLA
ncbi:Branched-chain amino acid transport [Sulfitobacter noctilucicola]|uniref:Branched-subunit amino acid transport protein n=1 Tax=Sulfitobacter noctilucicola TaxID=1342301 RepID=A0A7W6M6P1_9RHOB|nr:AzlD domain-containing protein [Sulfitobacter noctilucicola]KIN62100.1 Branched-chain amino acid transport [Sulfitobacter noctilucicola]MBB4173381.1 branched-subunit amino acid transport protein [Sulfitobacter noctilucicola]